MTILVHCRTPDRAKDKIETTEFIKYIRELNSPSLKIYSFEAGNDHGTLGQAPDAYDNMYYEYIKQLWGLDDMIILEDDKVPTLDNLGELIHCKANFCVFPYRFSWPKFITHPITRMTDWKWNYPFGLGFCKFSLQVQKEITPDHWGYSKKELDRSISIPVIGRFGLPHIHEEWVKHNHGYGITI